MNQHAARCAAALGATLGLAVTLGAPLGCSPAPSVIATDPTSPDPSGVAATTRGAPRQCGPWPERLPGLCNASAMTSLPDCRLLVADDEDTAHRLFVYSAAHDGAPAAIELGPMLAAAGAELDAGKELDLEGSAVVGDRIYWIGSHGNNKLHWEDGEYKKVKARKNRRLLFATTFPGTGNQLQLAGKPYRGLAMLIAAQIDSLGQSYESTHVNAGGLNIEGLASDGGGGLLLGLRSPAAGSAKKAYVFRLENPDEVLEGKPPRLAAEPFLLDLGRRGIRSMEWSPFERAWYIVAGPVTHVERPPGGAGDPVATSGYGEGFALYRWANVGEAAILVRELTGLNAESLIVAPDGLFLGSDDDEELRGGSSCEALKKAGEPVFARSQWLPLPAR